MLHQRIAAVTTDLHVCAVEADGIGQLMQRDHLILRVSVELDTINEQIPKNAQKDPITAKRHFEQWQIEFVFQNEHRIMSPGKFTVEKAVSQE